MAERMGCVPDSQRSLGRHNRSGVGKLRNLP